MEKEQYIAHIGDQSDAYERTIQTIISFDAAIRWDDKVKDYFKDSYFLPGRRFTASSNDVTPDVAIQLSKYYGIVGEVKITASTENDFKNAHEQIKKYDDKLEGWITENKTINKHDISLIVDDLKRNAAKRYFDDKSFKRNLTLIAYALITERKAFCKIEKYFGEFSENKIEEKLKDPIPVPLEKIIGRVSSVKFCDAPPPLEYTMNVLWMNVFNEIAHEEEETSAHTIKVDCDTITKILQKKYSFK